MYDSRPDAASDFEWVSMAGLVERMHWVETTLVCNPRFAPDPSAVFWPDIVRSRLGKAMYSLQEQYPEARTPFGSLEALFHDRHKVRTDRYEQRLERPFVFRTALSADGDAVLVTLSFLGRFAEWAIAITEAVAREFAHTGGGSRGPAPRLQLQPEADVQVHTFSGLPAPGKESELIQFELDTPLVFRRDGAEMAPFSILFERLASRAAGLAPWFGVLLERDIALEQYARESTLFDTSELRETVVERPTASGRRKRVVFKGQQGIAWLRIARRQLVPYLSFGAICHVGGRVSFGCGRYAFAFLDT